MPSPDTKTLYEFKKQIKALKSFRGRGTELISVYITPGYSVSDVVAKLRDEFGQAANIKSKSTQKNVQAALERAMHYLKQLGHKPPENGIAVFTGNISEAEGKTDIALYSIIPPFPLQTQFYRCDSAFVTEPLEDMFEKAGNYGLVVMDGKDATVAILKGKVMKVLKHIHSTAHGKFVKGGQCLHEDTLIQKADGSIIPIKELAEGEAILSADLRRHKAQTAECTAIYSRTSNKAYKLSFKNPQTSITATPEHLFFVLDGAKYAERSVAELKKGDKVDRKSTRLNSSH